MPTPPDSPLDLLVVAPHPDDAELGCGGAIVRSVREGMRVGVLDLTSGEPTPHGSLEIREQETAAATEILGLAWRGNLGLTNRALVADLESRRKLAEVFRQARPRIVIFPYWDDAHPDHVAASRLCDDARFHAKLTKTEMAGEPFWPPKVLYYFSVHLRIHPKPAFLLDISDAIEEKLAAIGCYESQFITGRPAVFPTILDDLRARARYWGWAIGKPYAEPFATREEIGLETLRSLV